MHGTGEGSGEFLGWAGCGAHRRRRGAGRPRPRVGYSRACGRARRSSRGSSRPLNCSPCNLNTKLKEGHGRLQLFFFRIKKTASHGVTFFLLSKTKKKKTFAGPSSI